MGPHHRGREDHGVEVRNKTGEETERMIREPIIKGKGSDSIDCSSKESDPTRDGNIITQFVTEETNDNATNKG